MKNQKSRRMLKKIFCPRFKYLFWSFVGHYLLGLAISPAFVEGGTRIPDQSDWTDRGVVLTAGPVGSWDTRLFGARTPATVIRKGGIYFLYYIGADGTRSDTGPSHRALGVATSSDGINFTKYAGNPVLTFLPNNDEEEGIQCATALLYDGTIYLYYGALIDINYPSEFVNEDVRLATSTNGYSFIDQGIVLDHSDRSVWGYGDELYPVAAFKCGDTWNLYYTVKSAAAGWHNDLGRAWGSSSTNLSNSEAVLTSGSYVIDGSGPAFISADQIALFVTRDYAKFEMEVRTASTGFPGSLSAPVETYSFDDVGNNAVFLDEDTNTWFLYYLYRDGDQDEIRVKTAPVVGGDLVISNLTVASGKAYEVVYNGLQIGALVYIDRTYTYSSVANWLKASTYIKTANDDKGSSGGAFITFDVNQDVTVYVAHDDRITAKPSWLASFTDTGDDLDTTDSILSVFAKDFSAGTVTLGGNEGGDKSMYTIIIVGKRSDDQSPPAPPMGLKIN
jgi:hypothetical protein